MLFDSIFCFTFVNYKKMGSKHPFLFTSEKMKDRIRQIMESQHMTQQVFADFIGIAPATLSGIFTERTKPTINTIDAIKKKIPTLNTDWLLFGKEPMYMSQERKEEETDSRSSSPTATPTVGDLFDFQEKSPVATPVQTVPRQPQISNSGRSTRLEMSVEDMNYSDKHQRKITEIRVFYDDQTWESFVPAKK